MKIVTTTILSTFSKLAPNYVIDNYVLYRNLAGNDLEGTLDFITNIPSTLYYV
jgi:hypothetical protein